MRSLVASLAFLALASAASADSLIATGVLVSNVGGTDLVCYVTNYGSKAVTLTPSISGAAIALMEPSDDGCQDPLQPGLTCSFVALDPLLGNAGGAVRIKGSAKAIRGHCTLTAVGGAALQSEAMR